MGWLAKPRPGETLHTFDPCALRVKTPISIKIGDWVSPPLAHMEIPEGVSMDECVIEFLAMLFEKNERLEEKRKTDFAY